MDVVDFVIIILSFLANIITVNLEDKAAAWARVLVAFRIIRVFMFFRFYNEKRNMEKAARKVR